ncbi:hypothetical protein LUZ60_009115 [Juncus effusus]|nr:hypothetical protein LUZ60_009115 [Juncus effusus]
MDSGSKSSPQELFMLAHALERLLARNDSLSESSLMVRAELTDKNQRSLESFVATRAPTIGLGRYLERIHRFADLEPSCFILAYAYVDRTVHNHPDLLVVSMNVHRLILVCLLVASKVLDDLHHNNAFFARVGGISNSELNKLELELLFLLDFSVTVSSNVFERYYSHLKIEMSRNSVNDKVLKSPFDEFEKEDKKWMNGSNRNGRRHSMSPPRHSFHG